MIHQVLLASVVSLFNEQPLFTEPVAFPRSPETSISVDSAKYLGHRIGYINAAIGRDLPLVTLEGSGAQYQLVLQGGTWVSLGYKEGRFPLLTQDFYFSVGPQFRYGTLSGALKFNHISAHLGDGIDELIYETLTEEEKAQYDQAESFTGQDILLVAPKSYSRDYESLQLAWEPPGRSTLNTRDRLYLQVGYAHKMIPRHLGRWYIGVGDCLTYPGHHFDFFAANDVTWNQDVDSIDYSLRTGILLADPTGLFQVQIALTYYNGSDRRGQLVGRRLEQIGFGVFIQ